MSEYTYVEQPILGWLCGEPKAKYALVASGGPIATRRPCSPAWLKMKNPDVPAVKRQGDEDWGKGRDRRFTSTSCPRHRFAHRRTLRTRCSSISVACAPSRAVSAIQSLRASIRRTTKA